MEQVLDSKFGSSRAHVQYGGFAIRFVAYIVDTIVVSLPFFLVAVSAGMYSQSFDGQLPPMAIGMMILSMFAVLLYFPLMESSAWQATVGKKAMGLVVVNELGGRIGFGQAIGRFLSKILSGLVLYIGYLMIIWDSRKQGLHDKLANTYVVRKETLAMEMM